MRFYRLDRLETELTEDVACKRYIEMRENGLSHNSCYILLETRVKYPDVINEFADIYESGMHTVVHIRLCPFCHSACEAQVVDARCGAFAVVCDMCDASGPVDCILPEAIRRWNDRFAEPCKREHNDDMDDV
jgi:hypothetical protein